MQPQNDPTMAQMPSQTPFSAPANVYAPPPMMYMMPYTYTPPQPLPERPVNQLPLVAMIFGIFAWPFLATAPRTNDFPYIALILSLVPIIMGHIALVTEPKEGMSRGNGMAVTALILGYALLSITLVWFVLRYFPGN
jgi:hypothetical protein